MRFPYSKASLNYNNTFHSSKNRLIFIAWQLMLQLPLLEHELSGNAKQWTMAFNSGELKEFILELYKNTQKVMELYVRKLGASNPFVFRLHRITFFVTILPTQTAPPLLVP